MSLTKVTRTVVDSISSFFGINNTTGAITSVIPDLMPSNSTLYPSFACRAWVNFDGTRDSTGASNTNNTNRFIRGSGNVSSVLRNGTGDYTVNFTTAMPDVNYSIIGSSGDTITTGSYAILQTTDRVKSVTQFSIGTRSQSAGSPAPVDFNNINVAVFR